MSELGLVLAGFRILVTPSVAPTSWAVLWCAAVPVSRSPRPLGWVPHVDEAGLLEATRKILADPVDVVVVTTGIGFRRWLDTAEAAGLADDLTRVLASVRLVARGPNPMTR